MTQVDLAAKATCSSSMICKIERGSAMPDAGLHARLAHALALPPTRLDDLTNMSLARASRATTAVLNDIQSEDWFGPALRLVGLAGLCALIGFGVAAVLAEQHPHNTRLPRVV